MAKEMILNIVIRYIRRRYARLDLTCLVRIRAHSLLADSRRNHGFLYLNSSYDKFCENSTDITYYDVHVHCLLGPIYCLIKNTSMNLVQSLSAVGKWGLTAKFISEQRLSICCVKNPIVV